MSRAPRLNTDAEPNMLTHADLTRRQYTTAAGTLKAGYSAADYSAAYADAQELDRVHGVNPTLRVAASQLSLAVAA